MVTKLHQSIVIGTNYCVKHCSVIVLHKTLIKRLNPNYGGKHVNSFLFYSEYKYFNASGGYNNHFISKLLQYFLTVSFSVKLVQAIT